MARHAIQAACIEQGTPKEKLREQLDKLASKEVITNNLKDCSHAARWIGNDAAHPGEGEVTKEDADDV
jgi:hypothetical protein